MGGFVRGGGADDGLSAVAKKSTGEERARCALELWMRLHGNCRFPISHLNGFCPCQILRQREKCDFYARIREEMDESFDIGFSFL